MAGLFMSHSDIRIFSHLDELGGGGGWAPGARLNCMYIIIVPYNTSLCIVVRP